MRNLAISIEFSLHRLWIGAVWRRDDDAFDLWFGPLPCIQIHLSAWRNDSAAHPLNPTMPQTNGAGIAWPK